MAVLGKYAYPVQKRSSMLCYAVVCQNLCGFDMMPVYLNLEIKAKLLFSNKSEVLWSINFQESIFMM